MPRLDPDIIRRDIEALIASCPEMEDDEALRHDMIEGSTEALELLSVLIRRIGQTKALAKGTAEYQQELAERKARFERRVDGYRSLMIKMVRHTGIKKAIERPEGTVSVRDGALKLHLIKEDAIPDALCKFTPSPDKTAIKEALEAGADVDWAALVPGDPILTIRTK